MIINEAYLVALSATVTSTYIPVMTPGLLDTFPGPPDTFPGYIGQFPGRLLMQILIFYPRLVQWSGGKISIYPSKEVQEIDQYIQETCQEVQETCVWVKVTCN